MSYLDRMQYLKETEFNIKRLNELKPIDLVQWFNKEVFSQESLGENDLVKESSSTIGYWKIR